MKKLLVFFGFIVSFASSIFACEHFGKICNPPVAGIGIKLQEPLIATMIPNIQETDKDKKLMKNISEVVEEIARKILDNIQTYPESTKAKKRKTYGKKVEYSPQDSEEVYKESFIIR